MADKIKFLYGSTADINNPSSSNYPAVVRGQVYFAVDSLTNSAANGQLYFDVPIGTGTQAKRILMNNRVAFATNASSALYASTAELAKKDDRSQNIANTYIKGISVSGTSLTYTLGNNNEHSITLQDLDEKLKVTSTASVGSKIYLIGNSASTLGTAGNSVTSTALVSKDIYIGTDGFLQGNVKTKNSLKFSNEQTFNGTTEVNVGDTIHYLPGTSTATSATNYSQTTATGSGVYSARWGAITDNSITSLYSGLTIAYKITAAGNGSYNNVLRITKADGTAITNPNNTAVNNGYYPVVYNDASWIGTRYPVGSILLLVFDADKVITDHRPVNGNTMSITGCWKMVDYDSTNIYQLKSGYSNYLASTTVYRYQLLLTVDEQHLMPINVTDNSTATTKTLLNTPFDPFGQIYFWSTTATRNKDAALGDYAYEQLLIDLRYSFNTGTTLTARKAVYLVTSLPNASGKVTLDASPITQTLPTANTDKLYIYLGQAYDNYRIELIPVHPVYTFQNGALRFYAGYADHAKTATSATNDARSQNIADTYIKGLSISGTTLTYTYGNNNESTLTLQDIDEKLKVTSTASIGSKVYLIGNPASSLGTAGNSVTSTGLVNKDIYIGTDGYLQGNVKTKGSLRFSNEQTFDGASNTNVGDTIHYLPGTSTATSGTNYSQVTATGSGIYSTRWGAIVDDSITSLYSGLTIAYKIPIAGNGSYGNVLKLTKADGTAITNPNNTSANNGYYPVIKETTGWLTTHYPVGSIILLVFDADQVTTNLRPVNSNTMSITGCWKTVDYDSTNIYQLRHSQGNYIASTSVYRYQLLAEVDDAKMMPFTTTNNSTGTSKTVNTAGFRPFGYFLYWNTTSTVATNGNLGPGSLYSQITLDLRYSFNVTTSVVTAHRNVYLVTSLPSDSTGLVTLDTTTPIVDALPTTNTDKLYILLGRSYNGYCIELYPVHPVYAFLNGRMRAYTDYADYAKAAGSATNDARGQNIADTYIKGISVSGTTLTYTYGNNNESTATLQDNDYRLKVTSTSSNSQKIYLFGSTATSLGTNNQSVTGTGMSRTDIYIGTDGIINGTIKNASTASYATKALQDNRGQQIDTTYLASFISTAVNGTVPTIIFSNGAGSEYTNRIKYTPIGDDGKIDLKYLPNAALERVHVVASTAAMIALTTATVQNGDVVKVTNPGTMYYVKDDTKLNQLAGYEEFAVGTAGSVAWSNVTGKPVKAIVSTASQATLSTSASTATIKISWINLENDELVNTLVIPAAATNVAGLITTGAQTFAGAKTFNSTATFSNRLNYSGIQVGSGTTNYIWFASSATKGIPTYSTDLYYDVSAKVLHTTVEKAMYDNVTSTATIAKRYIDYYKTSLATATNVLTVTNGAGDEKTFQIQNYYPSSATWSASSSSVTLTIRNRSQHSATMTSSIVTATIPVATTTAAGIVTSSAQTFGGLKTFKDGINVTGKFKVDDATDSSHSQDQNASIFTQGGISVAKQLSAKQIRIDDNTSTEGVVLQYNGGQDVLSFVFV